MNFGGLQNMLGQMGGGPGAGPTNAIPDSSETIIISSLALLKMLKHGRAGIPMEVMGLMLGSFIGMVFCALFFMGLMFGVCSLGYSFLC
jgi:hypothetical protein